MIKTIIKTPQKYSSPISIFSIYQSRILLFDELWINREVYGGNKRVVNEFPATYALREVSEGVRARRGDILAAFVRARAKGGARNGLHRRRTG